LDIEYWIFDIQKIAPHNHLSNHLATPNSYPHTHHIHYHNDLWNI